MKPLLVLKDKDIFPDAIVAEDIIYQMRLAVKIIVVDSSGKISLVGTKQYRLLPGGGVEEGETMENAVRRECLEEVGCNVEIEKEIGVTEEYRAQIQRHQETHFFLTYLIGEKGIPQTTQENEQGMKVEWYTLDNAIDLLKKEVIEIPPSIYNGCFNARTHLVALEELKKIGLMKKVEQG